MPQRSRFFIHFRRSSNLLRWRTTSTPLSRIC
jgi:hypothetical protein